MLQLAHVAGPRVTRELRGGLARDASERFLIFMGIKPEEMVGQETNVVAPFPQGRNGQLDRIDPIKEVLAKRSLGDPLPEIGVRGADEAGAAAVQGCQEIS